MIASARPVMVTPSVLSRILPTLSQTALALPLAAKPAVLTVLGPPNREAVGRVVAAEVSGTLRSGGTSSGRFSTLVA